MKLPSSLAPLGRRDFTLFWFGFATTRMGRSIEETGAVWLMYELTGSPVLLGLLGLARAAPSLILSPIGGVVADRVDQRRLLFATQGLGLLASAILGFLVITGLVEYWHLYLQVAAHASIEAFDGSARLALFPRLVPRAQLTEAVTLNSTAARFSQLIGPAIGGVAIASLGESAPFILNAGTFLVLMAAVTAMNRLSAKATTGQSSFRGEMADGLRYIVRQPVLSGLIKLEVVISTFQVNPVLITIVGREILGVGPVELGILLSGPAAGSLIAIFGMLTLGHVQRQGRFVVLCAYGYAATLIVFALAPGYWASFAALAAVGLFDALLTVTRHSVMQLAAPPEMRGRVMGNMATVTRGMSPLAEVQSGLMAAIFGPVLAAISAAGVLAGAALVTMRANAALWHFSRDHGRDVPAPAIADTDEPLPP